MSNIIQRPQAHAVGAVNTFGFNPEHYQVIKSMVSAEELTDAEFMQFLIQCKRTGLDPVLRQIYIMKDKRTKRVSIITSIDGFRLIAERSGKYAGQDGPYWCGPDGQWTDVWLKPEPPVAAKVGVHKEGFKAPLYAVALFNEYAKRHKFDDTNNRPPRYKAGDLQSQWAPMPALMIAKVAEALAIRKAFPNDLSGIYTSDEMDQAIPDVKPQVTTIQMAPAPAQLEHTPAMVATAAPQAALQPVAAATMPVQPQGAPIAPQAKASPEAYRVPFGKYKGQTLAEIGSDKLDSYIAYIRNKANQDGKEITGQVSEFITHAESYLFSAEQAQPAYETYGSVAGSIEDEDNQWK